MCVSMILMDWIALHCIDDCIVLMIDDFAIVMTEDDGGLY